MNIEKRKKFIRQNLFALVIVVVLSVILLNQGFSKQAERMTIIYKGQHNVALGISFVQQHIPGVDDLSALSVGDNQNYGISYFLQSQTPAVLLFLDYIVIYPDSDIAKFCINKISITRPRGKIPVEITYDPSFSIFFKPDKARGFLEFSSDKYTYTFPSNPATQCLVKGEQGSSYIYPHSLIGILPVEMYAKLLNIPLTSGHRANRFFPFDEQKIIVNLVITGTINDDPTPESFSPTIEGIISEEGWAGNFENSEGNGPTLHLYRIPFYKWILFMMFFVMFGVIIFLNDLSDSSSSFFQASTGILVGLWGIHEVLVPNYIVSSVVVDYAIYILYLLTVLEICITQFVEVWQIFRKNQPNKKGTSSEVSNPDATQTKQEKEN